VCVCVCTWLAGWFVVVVHNWARGLVVRDVPLRNVTAEWIFLSFVNRRARAQPVFDDRASSFVSP
jgi:hypothetical protein